MVKLSDIELPVTFKKHLLFKAGSWNNWEIDFSEVNRSVSNTKWNQLNRSLFYSHKDQEAEAWVGNVNNVFSENGAVYGDVEIWDPETALKAKYGRASFAISAGIAWPDTFDQPKNFFYRNFSIVANPGVAEKDIYLNFSAKENIGEYKTAIFSSSLNELSEMDNTPKEIVAEQITPLENEVKEEIKEEVKEEIKVEEPVQEIVEIKEEVKEEIKEEIFNIDERRLQDKKLMETKEESQNTPTVPEEKPVVVPEVPKEIKETVISPVLDEKAVDTIVDRLAEKINSKPVPIPAPVTTNEFSGRVEGSEEEVVERLVTNLFKK